MTWNLYYEIFPLLWPLRRLGNHDFNKFQKLAKIITTTSKVYIVLGLLAATGGSPWFIDNYDLILPVKLAMDNFKGWFLQALLIIFFLSCYHMALTVVAVLSCMTYLLLHLYNQIRMLKERLTNLSNAPNLAHALKNTAYQDFVKTELISCIKLHQVLLKLDRKLGLYEMIVWEYFRYTQRINDLMYYPIFYYSAGLVLIGLSLILMPVGRFMRLHINQETCLLESNFRKTPSWL